MAGIRVALVLLGLGPLAIGAAAAPGPPTPQRPPSSIHPETSSAAEALLKTASSHVRQGQWDSAVELFQRAIAQFPEVLTAIGPVEGREVGPAPGDGDGFEVYVNVSEYAQRRLATLPPEALARYRNRVDAEARVLLDRGRDLLDPEPLRQVVQSYFCSSWGDDAAELLADLRFQEGAFDEALALYRRLLPSSDPEQVGSIYPDPDVDVARVAAKAMLAAEAAGRSPGSDAVRRFAEAYPGAEGELAGRRGPYAEILEAAIAEDGLPLPGSSDTRWPTFGGSPTRTKVLPEPVEPGELVWSISLRGTFDAASNLNASPPMRPGDPFGAPQDDSPAYFPVLRGDELILTDGRAVQSYALDGDGEAVAAPPPTWRPEIAPGTPAAARNTVGVDRHTLTVLGDRIYARIGPSGAEYQLRNNARAPATLIVALDRERSDGPIWSIEADEVMGRPGPGNAMALGDQVAFGGAPVADEYGVYVTLVKPGTQTLTWVACLDPERGRPRWVRYICSGSSPLFSQAAGMRNRGMILNPELGHRLLSLDGSTLYYQTDLGALASIDARSGRLNWLATYPRTLDAPRSSPEAVNHNPAVVHGDRVIVSPEDSDRIFAFDRATGRLAWQANPGGRVAHLLGVASGRVVATGDHVWTIDLETGALRSRWPEGQTLEQGYGRGLLAGGEIYWPTRDRLYILDQQTGRPTDRPPIPLREAYGCGGGNLIAGDGYLVIAEREYLRVFCKPSRMLRYYQERIEEEPEEPSHYYRLARTAEALGDVDLALEGLDRALELAGSSDWIDGRRLVEAARDERFKVRIKRARILLDTGKTAEAADEYRRAAAEAPRPRDRVTAELARAEAVEAAGDPAGAVDLLQGLLADPVSRGIDLPAGDRHSLRADLFLVDRLRELIQEHGKEVYARHEAEAEALLRRGLEAEDPRILAEVVRSYAASASAPEALAGIGGIEERREHWSEAASAYHRLVVSSADDRRKAIGLLGLARSYEAIGLESEAREAYRLASSRYGAIDVEPEVGSGPIRVSEYVAGRFSASPTTARLDASMPLARRWRRAWPEGFEPLGPEGESTVPAGPEGLPVVLIGGTRLLAVEPEGGPVRWERELERRPDWSGIAAGRLILGFPDRLVGIDPIAGETLWEAVSGAGDLVLGRPADPDGKREDPAGPPLPGGEFRTYRLYGDRLYVSWGARGLVCLDPIAGRPEWTYHAPSQKIHPNVGLGLARVVIQLREPNAIAVLDARDGRTLGQFPQDETAGLWRRDPFPVAFGRVALVPDGSTVELFDLDSGRTVWEAREPSALPTSPRPSPSDPMVLGDAERLLVLRGETLQRLDPADGKELWSAPIGRIRADRRAKAIALGHEALFTVGSPASGSGLAVGAVSLADGARLWSESLPGDANESWGLGLTPSCVVAYRLDDGTPGSGPDEPVVLNLLRRDSGARVQRLVLEATGAGRRVWIGPGGIRVSDTSGLWALSSLEDSGLVAGATSSPAPASSLAPPGDGGD
ncbi:outer membrane protein assembly factor BamB family protein [Tautonia sociabilis]|uniref:outer membrane protein assembly factor BamB family protein n=1 Tax=Tautonia sociabilis TaxID=2080755 RepID=UPI0013159BE8|nr:PQQ-binding-like beta-propeller repeat protein [Tautonia sociabilis]